VSVTSELKPVADFSSEERTAVRELKAAVYPDRPEGYPGRDRQWDAPRWGVLVTAGDILVSYTGVVERAAAVDGRPTTIGGVGGVATHPSHRGRGYAPLGIGRALDFLLRRDVAFALLVCRDELVDYYSDLGWSLFPGTVYNTQFGEREVFIFNRVMVGDLTASAPTSGTIDLRGPAW